MIAMKRLAASLAFALVGLGLTAADGCDPNVKEPSGQSRKACDTRPMGAPVVVRLGNQVAVKATSISECDKAPDEHVVKVWMEFKDGSDWVPQADKAGVTWGECRELPRPLHPVTCERLLFNACKNGRWRIRILVNGWGDGRPFGLSVPEKPEARIICPKK